MMQLILFHVENNSLSNKFNKKTPTFFGGVEVPPEKSIKKSTPCMRATMRQSQSERAVMCQSDDLVPKKQGSSTPPSKSIIFCKI